MPSKRSFYALKRIKTSLGSTTTNSLLNHTLTEICKTVSELQYHKFSFKPHADTLRIHKQKTNSRDVKNVSTILLVFAIIKPFSNYFMCLYLISITVG